MSKLYYIKYVLEYEGTGNHSGVRVCSGYDLVELCHFAVCYADWFKKESVEKSITTISENRNFQPFIQKQKIVIPFFLKYYNYRTNPYHYRSGAQRRRQKIR